MTRINVGVLPSELTDKHLLAEHREIKRIPNMVASGKAKIENIPEKFTLGTGHVKFFYDKLKYLHKRYKLIYQECKRRGFNVTNYEESWNNKDNVDWALKYYKDYIEQPEDRILILQRINEKLNKDGKVYN